jgi:NADPH-dependent glutamate synthase beta subunit-like oxidoreductase
MIERLPTPWGLVRSGVAPDHPKIKTVSKVFEKIANTENFRLFANVEVGTDITIAQLKEKYDAVIIATGSSIGKKLGIPGEELRDHYLQRFLCLGTTLTLILLAWTHHWIQIPQLLLVLEMLRWMLLVCWRLNQVS